MRNIHHAILSCLDTHWKQHCHLVAESAPLVDRQRTRKKLKPMAQTPALVTKLAKQKKCGEDWRAKRLANNRAQDDDSEDSSVQGEGGYHEQESERDCYTDETEMESESENESNKSERSESEEKTSESESV